MKSAQIGLRMTLVFLSTASLSAMMGCSDKLETGYEPHTLKATPAQRRGYYAEPFTPEAAAAAQEQGKDDMTPVRSQPGYGGYR